MRYPRCWAVTFALGLLTACTPASDIVQTESDAVETPNQKAAVQPGTVDKQPAAIASGVDYHSFANYTQVRVSHLELDLDADFEKRQLSGEVTLTYERIDESANELILDTRDLEIIGVHAEDTTLAFSLSEADANLGAALQIKLPDDGEQLTIVYKTSPQASGLQWLTPKQTASQTHPFLFTQAQAIHARSFIPLQDSPAVRVTYQANISTPPAMLAVMSAANDPETERDGEYSFTMPQPIPSYLIALAIGDLHFQSMGPRTGVYAEKPILSAAANEFSDTEAMLEQTEKRYGPYSWDRYDLLILPPSFPFGGMENPRLSFITPTVIAGDKSLVALIAHELAHSWSGNTVTNATWRDLWLNEGFTTYLTYRIMEMIFGTERYKMEAVLGYQDLQADIARLSPQDQILAIDLRGRDPDDVFSNIPYEKGALFLREIEHTIGRDNFDQFLLEYFEHFAFQSITTDAFIEYLDDTLLTKHADQLDRERMMQWIFEPGLPQGAPVPESDAFTRIDTTRQAWLSGELEASAINTEKWTVHEWLYFLNNLPAELSDRQLKSLDTAFTLTESKNNEIAHSWLLISVNNWYEPAFTRLHEYLVTIGRNKLVKPLYRALSQTAAGKALAKKAFAEAKDGYHPLTVKANEPFVSD